MNKTTRAISKEEYKEIITTITEGFTGCRPNERIATVLTLEANLGLRVSDILQLKLSDIISDANGRKHLAITEQKTGKKRTFTVPNEIYLYIQNYALKHDIPANERLFTITERAVQKQLKLVCDYLELDNISTHSFRKFFATEIYKDSGFDIALVSKLLQHSSTAVTQKYIGISTQDIEQALQKHIFLID